MERYTEQEQKLLDQYFEMLRWTRKSGKLSESIKKRQLEYFLKYDKKIVLEAIKLHLRKYPQMREEYTRGIIRNLERTGQDGLDRGRGSQASRNAEGLAGRDRAAADAIASRLG